MVGVSAPTISNWKRRYVEGGHMDIPEIDPDEIKHLSPDGRARMTGEELEGVTSTSWSSRPLCSRAR